MLLFSPSVLAVPIAKLSVVRNYCCFYHMRRIFPGGGVSSVSPFSDRADVVCQDLTQ